MSRPPKKANLNRFTADELRWLINHRCKHGHKYVSHFNCFLSENNIEERIGYLDIEASNLKANFGIVLTWAIKDGQSDTIYYDHLTPTDVKKYGQTEDKRILETCVDTIREFDRIVTHYGGDFQYDMPYLRTRCMMMGVPFLKYGEVYVADTFTISKRKMSLSSRRQDIIAEALSRKPSIKSRINSAAWRGAVRGNKADIMEVLDHNFRDVKELESNFLAMLPYVKLTKKSI
jgi:uncharacterized protein YprB with RNaseH-like and TPR domain